MKSKPLNPGSFRYFLVINGILLGNMAVNLAADFIADVFFINRNFDVSEGMTALLTQMDASYGMICTVVILVVTLWYERPIRKCVKLITTQKTPPQELLMTAQKRLLNEPYMVVVMNTFIWGLGSFLYAGMGLHGGLSTGIATGLIAAMAAFFWAEHASQHHLVPLFFPDGDLSKVKGAKSIGLQVRLAALVCTVSLVPLAFIHVTIYQFQQMQIRGEIPQAMLADKIQQAVAAESILFMVMSVLIALLVGHNLKRPVAEIIQTMGQIKKGDFDARATIYTTDEIGFSGETLNAMAEGLKERQLIKDTFGRYVDTRIRDEILKGEIPLDGELKEATILFADLRDFTPLVEKTPPKELIHLLNDYLTSMSQVIEEHGGLVLQFIGDEIEAVFGAPVYTPDHTRAALNAALAMRQRLGQLNESHAKEGYAALHHGIGIHTGTVLAANIGSLDRSAYSLIGDTVNLASRIQGLTKKFNTDILVSETIAAKLGDSFEFEAMPIVKVKGKSVKVRTSSLIAHISDAS